MIRHITDIVDFDAIACYQPVVGGLRHLTAVTAAPHRGEIVRLLCGMSYAMGAKRRSPHVYDCSGCTEAYLDTVLIPHPRSRDVPCGPGLAREPEGWRNIAVHASPAAKHFTLVRTVLAVRGNHRAGKPCQHGRGRRR
jgi:hypothetical protein